MKLGSHRLNVMKTYAKRKFIRVKILRQARLEFGGTGYDPCRIRDLSLSGMFVFGRFDQEVGDECTIRYSQTSAASHFHFQAKARVARSGRDGIAIEFISMPFDSYMLLQTTLLYEADDPLAICLQIPEVCPFEITLALSKKSREECSSRPSLPALQDRDSI